MQNTLNKRKIHVIMGLAGSGKTTLQNKITNDLYVKNNVVYADRISIADKLRETCFKIVGYPYLPSNYDNFKKRLLYLDGFPDYVSSIAKGIVPFWLTGRQLLQIVGDNIARIFGKDVWIRETIKTIYFSTKDVIIDDCRKKHELIALRKYCSDNNYEMILYFTDYRSDKYNDKDNHVSEQMALWIRDNLKLPHRYCETLPSFYYKKDGTKVTINDITNKNTEDLYSKIINGFEENIFS